MIKVIEENLKLIEKLTEEVKNNVSICTSKDNGNFEDVLVLLETVEKLNILSSIIQSTLRLIRS